MTRTTIVLGLTLLTSLGVVVPVAGTGVIAFRTSASIVLAADAALTSVDARGTILSVDATGCKLGQAGGWFFVWGGHQAGGTSEDLRSAFTRTIAPARTLASLTVAVRRFIDHHIRTLDWTELGAIYGQPGRIVFWVSVGRVEHGVPQLGIYRAHVSQLDPIALSVVSPTCPGDCGRAGWLAAGHAAEEGPIAALLSLPSTAQPPWLSRLDGPAAHRLLSLQTDATPRQVKRPLDVLEVTSSGARWVNRDPNSNCPDNPVHLGGTK